MKVLTTKEKKQVESYSIEKKAFNLIQLELEKNQRFMK